MADSELYVKLEHLLGVRRTEEVRRLVAPHLAATPDDGELHHYLARAAYLDDDSDQAREHLERVLGLDPAHEGARFLLSQVLVEQSEYAAAERLLIELIRENPADPDYLAAYARLMLLTLHFDKARLLTREALRHDPEHRGALSVEVLVATARGDHAHANRTLQDLLRDDPDAQHTTRILFYLLLKQNRYREAQKLGQQLLRANPNDEELVESLIELRTLTHWAALPVYPFVRFGWAGSAAMWVIGIVGARAIARYDSSLATVWVVAYIALCVYSWVYQPVLKRAIRAGGF